MQIPLWILLAVSIVGWGLWGVFEKLAIRQTSLFMVQLIGTIAFLVYVLISYFGGKPEEQLQFTYSGLTWSCLASLVSFMAGWAALKAMQNLDANYVIGITSSSPVVTFIICAFLLGEHVTPLKIIGITVVVLGMLLISI